MDERMHVFEGNTRTERDSLGERVLPADAPYGIQTSRAIENFPVSGRKISDIPGFVQAILEIKKAAALANADCGALDAGIAAAIAQAAQEHIDHPRPDAFPVDVFHGGGGTSANMNANEVLALRATSILQGERTNASVDPLDHVNCGQSTNDVIPAAMKITAFRLLGSVIESVEILLEAVHVKEKEFAGVVKLGRTCLQDAVPLTLGQQFSGYRAALERQIDELRRTQSLCLHLPLSATAVGTELGTSPGYGKAVFGHLRQITGIAFVREQNLFDALQNADVWLQVSRSLVAVAQLASKMSSDLRLMSSGPRGGLGEIRLPAVQPGSSIMPGKVNPVIPEMAMQVYFRVLGNDASIVRACEGELDLNVWESLILHCAAESACLLAAAFPLLARKCVSGIVADAVHCEALARNSLAMSTVVASRYGYERAAAIAYKAAREGKSVEAVVVEEGLMTAQAAREALDPSMLTSPAGQARARGRGANL